MRAKPDYIALGPIFPTTLKSMRFAPQGIAKITEWKKRIGDIPLVAIGGIKFEQAAEIFAAGADFDRRRQRRHPKRRPRRAGAAVAGPERGGRVMMQFSKPRTFIRADVASGEASDPARRDLSGLLALRSAMTEFPLSRARDSGIRISFLELRSVRSEPEIQNKEDTP